METQRNVEVLDVLSWMKNLCLMDFRNLLNCLCTAGLPPADIRVTEVPMRTSVFECEAAPICL